MGGYTIRYLLGLDIGSSAVKASVLDIDTGIEVARAKWPEKGEFTIDSPRDGWAEQDPTMWWEAVVACTGLLREKSGVNLEDVSAIGIAYQMHGLVLVDENLNPLRPAIIWCDSRAVDIGNRAAEELGEDYCLSNMLNLPGNFTASKLRWVRENEPDIYSKIYKFMLPGDFIATRLLGEPVTTRSGLSEGILWDFSLNKIVDKLLDHYDISRSLVPESSRNISYIGGVCAKASAETGLSEGRALNYLAGDQPNNAFSLNVLNPGEIAATAGTSGVIYGITDQHVYDEKSRVNVFLHVNDSIDGIRNGVLLCVNGTGILNRWLKENITGPARPTPISYDAMNKLASKIPVGSDGLSVLPYGNGAERTLENRDLGASVHNLDFNTHTGAHLMRASQEGIVFALDYGVEVMRSMGIKVDRVRAGNTNMFQSDVFAEAFANTIGVTLELYNTDGAQGAARAAGVCENGIFESYNDAFKGLEKVATIEPTDYLVQQYFDAKAKWRGILETELDKRRFECLK